MMSPLRKLLVAVGVVLSLAAAANPAALAARPARHASSAIGYSRDAQRVLTAARAAAGGAGWNYLRGWHETGRMGGLAYESWFDPLRYGMRIETQEPGGVHVHGFNGQGEWEILPNGEVHGGDGLPTVAAARTTAFLAVYGFFYPGRFDARGGYLGVRQAQGRAFDVVEVKPYGGQARELWFDRRTHLLGRIVARDGGAPAAVEVSDYRKIGPVQVAMRFAVEGGGGADRQVESLTFVPTDRDRFGLPRP
ncbi:hypothetical protein [Phenylobacterium sp.]|uniref:hypothetical protein n=1 Tax=Phenylobacterium sp. TaxID=1871053 RepID=UPI003567EFB0